ncbi:hypothetical protein [Dactylosporangium maewongense]
MQVTMASAQRILVALVPVLALAACDGSSSPPAPAATQASQCVGEQGAALQSIEHADAIRASYCREGFAFVRFAGPEIGVHGTQEAFFAWKDGRWQDIAWGETSHGAFIYESLRQHEGVDARRLATLFPEAGMTVAPDEPGFSVVVRADGIGDLKLGMTEAQARAASPFPLMQESGRTGTCTTLVTENAGFPALTVLIGRDGTVFAVSVTDSAQTAEGIHPASTRKELVAGYGDRLRAADTDLPYVEQADLRIAFQLMNHIVARIDAGRFATGTAAAACA